MNLLFAHTEELHIESTSQLEHLLTEPVSGFLIYIGSILVLALVAKIIGLRIIFAPSVALYSLAITFATAEGFRTLAIVTATVAAASALFFIYLLLSPDS